MARTRGTIVRRGNRWSVVIDRGRDPLTGKRKRTWDSGYATEDDAKKALASQLHKADTGRLINRSRQSLGQYLLDEWLPSLTKPKPSTLASYRLYLERHVVPRIGDIPLQQLKPPALNRLYRDLLESGSLRSRGGGLSPRTVRYIHAILRKALNDAVKWEYIERNPVLRAEPPEATRPRFRVWTPSEVGQFLEYVSDDRWFPAWLTLASTGMRRGEVLGLRWSDVELDPELGSPRLSVRQTLLAVKNEVSVSTPKTERSGRSIPLDAHLVAVLKRWRAQQAQERLAAGEEWSDDYGGLVFAHPDGRHIHPDRFSDWFRTHVQRVGLPKVRLHDLRHGWATYALEAGVAPRIVTEQLGHSSVAFTADTYTHVLEKVHSEAVERVARLVQGG